jgi:hypothetical protein
MWHFRGMIGVEMCFLISTHGLITRIYKISDGNVYLLPKFIRIDIKDTTTWH